MKATIIKTITLLFTLFVMSEISAQGVKVCIAVNGTPMPTSKTWRICRKNIATPNSSTTVTLTASNCATSPVSTISIKWTKISVLPHVDSLDNAITVSDTATWVATITNTATSTPYYDTIRLIFPPPIAISLDDQDYGDPSVEGCPLYDITITATPTGPVTSYKWFLFPGGQIPGATSSSYTFKQKETQYIAHGIDAYNCVAADTTRYYTQSYALTANLGSDTSGFCEGNIYNLNIKDDVLPPGYIICTTTPLVTQEYTFYYGINATTLGSFKVCGEAPPPTPVVVTPPGGTSRYWVRVEFYPYCPQADTVYVTTRPIPVVDINSGAASTLICYGDTKALNATVTLGTGPYTYAWTSSPASSLPSSSNISVSPTANTIYTVKVRDANNCGDGTDNITVNVNPQIITTVSNDTTICKDPLGTANLQATASGGTGALTYKWTPIGGLSSTNTLLTTCDTTRTTTYTFTATDANNCTDNSTVTVTSYEPPIGAISNPTIISETVSATLEAATSGNAGFDFVWKTDTSASIINTNTSLFVEYQGPDTVRYVIIVTNPTNMCVNKDTIQVWSISDNTLMYVPNVFSPNAINPENQTIKIYGDNLLPDGFKWVVYNKWGNLMYETDNLANAQSTGWDGGSMIEGVYTYYITGKFKNGKEVKESPYYKGNFTLIK